MHRIITGIIIFTSYYFGPAIAQATPEISVTLSAAEIQLDETSTLTITVQWPKDEASYTFAFPNLTLTNLSVEERGESREAFTLGNRDWVRKVFRIEFMPQSPGQGSIQAFELPYIDPIRQKGGRFSVPEQNITIKRPIKGFANILWLLSGIVGLGLLLFTVIVLSRRKSKKVPEGTTAATAIEKDVISLKNMIENRKSKSQKDYLYDLSRFTRQFIIRFYQIQEPLSSENEILEALARKQVALHERTRIKQIFDRFTEAKFTGYVLSENESKNLQEEITRFVEGKKVINGVENSSGVVK